MLLPSVSRIFRWEFFFSSLSLWAIVVHSHRKQRIQRWRREKTIERIGHCCSWLNACYMCAVSEKQQQHITFPAHAAPPTPFPHYSEVYLCMCIYKRWKYNNVCTQHSFLSNYTCTQQLCLSVVLSRVNQQQFVIRSSKINPNGRGLSLIVRPTNKKL